MPSYAKPFPFFSMKVSIINIGDELLEGKTLNTNSQWLGKKLSSAGCEIESQITVKDEGNSIVSGLNYCFQSKPEYLFVTGGLGPTNDDVTRNVLFNFMETESIVDYEYWKVLKNRYLRIGKDISESIKSQAVVPKIGEVIANPKGSARGLKFVKGDTIIFVLPGVPIEMKNMFVQTILPALIKKIESPILSRTLRTTGITESVLHDFIEKRSKKNKNKIGYYPSAFGVDIKVSNKTGEEINLFIDWMYANFRNEIYAEHDTSIERVVVEYCIKNRRKIAVAESCTGGLIGDRITNVSGSSEIFVGGIIVYSNDSKVKILGLDEKGIDQFGAVSKDTARKMAKNVKTMFNSSFGLSVTGIAGPSGGTKEKPVGLAYIGFASDKNTIVEKFNFGKDRETNKIKTSQAALNILRRGLLNE
ncbi:MAG: CinA family nicotinamide mononucleotide deamidase-related protein [Candidatus Neomarinimicrobiota bacterium]